MPATARATDERGYDLEVVALVDAINALPGLHTVESCCGHGEYPYRIWLLADTIGDLCALNYWLDRCHSGFDGWRLMVATDCSHDPATVHFLLEGPTGDESYVQAAEIARDIVVNELPESVLRA